MFPPRKKNGRLARLGEQPLHPNYKNEGGERFLHQKTSPPHSKERTRRLAVLGPSSHFRLPFAFIFGVIIHSNKYSILDDFSFPLVYFLHLLVLQIVRMCLHLWGSFGLFLCLFSWVEDLNEKAFGLCCILKQWGMPHCPHSLAIYVQTCAHQVLGEMPQWYMNVILQNWDGGAVLCM